MEIQWLDDISATGKMFLQPILQQYDYVQYFYRYTIQEEILQHNNKTKGGDCKSIPQHRN